MKVAKLEDKVEIPEGITVSYDHGIYIVKGPKGEVKKIMLHPRVDVKIEGNTVVFEVKKATKRELKIVNTYKAHMQNLFKGVAEGHIYKLKICSGHFPMNVAVKGDLFEINNFIGEKVPRRLKLRENTTVKIDGDNIVVESIDKEAAGQMAASIEQLTRRPGFDKRIFQDGIYLIDKDGRPIK
ncbi:MAG: 50S ribosomal protein L6 [archaeon]